MSQPEQRTVQAQAERLRVPPETYARVFTSTLEGNAVLEDLVARFHDGQMFDRANARQTDFNLGQREVVQFVLRRIGQIHAAPESNQEAG